MALRHILPLRDPETGKLRHLAHLPAVIALIVILMAAAFAESQSRSMHEQRARAAVLNEVSLIRARLGGSLNGNIQLVRGFVATLATEPGMDAGRFASLASAILGERSQIRHLAAAPDLVVSMVYPLAGNEAVLGFDYNTSDMQRDAALRARRSGDIVLAGPIALIQGGTGLVARFPVHVEEPGGGERFWGILSAVIDVERLYADAGLLDPQLPISVAISGRDGVGGDRSVFFGDEEIVRQNPVVVEVPLPNGSWRVAAVPRGGWSDTPPDLWRLRLWMLLAASLIMVPTVITGRLMEERRRNIERAWSREKVLETVSRRLQIALDTSRVGVWEVTLGEEEEFWDARMNEIYGYPPDGELRNYDHWARRVHPEDVPRANAEYEEALRADKSYDSHFRLIMPDGEIRHVRSYGAMYVDGGKPPKMVGVCLDVTADVFMTEELRRANHLLEARNAELEAIRRRIEFNALHDSLTGLPNRRYLDDTLNEHVRLFERGEEKAAILHIDLDRFKQINDTLGHAAGDAVLRHAARVLSETVSGGDFVARVGGDEFVVVCRRRGGAAELEQERLAELADRIIERMAEPTRYEGHDCRCGVSIGIASDADSLADPRRLLVNADIALYRAKAQGRNRYQFFNEALQGEIIRTKRIADEILAGIERGEFVPWFQPQVDAVTLDVVGVEALARWNHPVDGVLPPAAFMKIASEINVVDAIDRMILQQTIEQMQLWERQGILVPKASVNVSARRLNDEGLIDGLKKLPIKPGTIAFELVESIFLDDHDDLLAWNVDRIKALGIDVEIDDFGTGYASIVSLLKLKPSRLKIDRQFVMPVVHSPAQRQLVGSIVQIGRSLGIEVLAEGVETIEHARILKQLGCQALQGYAFARPMPARQATDFILAKAWREAS